MIKSGGRERKRDGKKKAGERRTQREENTTVTEKAEDKVGRDSGRKVKVKKKTKGKERSGGERAREESLKKREGRYS